MSLLKEYTEADLKKLFSGLIRKPITDRMMDILIAHSYNRNPNNRSSGFYYPGGLDAILNWDDINQIFSLEPVIPDVDVYDKNGDLYVPHFRFYSWYQGPVLHRIYEKMELELPDEEGLYMIYFGVDQEEREWTLQFIKNPEPAEIAETYTTGVIVAWIYWHENNSALYVGDSRHGSEWNPAFHWTWHQTLNSQRQSGLTFENIIFDGDGSEDEHFQFGISAGKIWHDDIFTGTDAVGEADSLPVWYFNAAGDPRFATSAGKKFLNTGSGRVAFNGVTGGLAEAPDQHFVAYHLFATNCQLHPHISVMGQASHTTLGAAVGSIEAEVATLRQDLPHANLMHIGSFVLQTSDGYTNGGKAIIVYTSAAEDVFVTDTDFNTDTGILTLFRSANRPPLEQPLDIGKLVVEAINNYPETITDIVNNIATTIVQNGIASMKESYLVDPVNDTSFTQLSSWFVEAPNELMGDFRAVVVVRDKTTHAIVTLQNTLGFDYTDAANEVEDDSAIITDGSITLVLSVDATTNKLKAVLSGMTANAKRIHFCFERCANNTVPPLTLDHLTGEGTPHNPTTEGEVGLTIDHLEGEGTVHEVTAEALGWELLAEFTTNSPNTTTFDPSISASSGEYKWDVGGVEVLGTSVSMTLDGTNQIVKLYGKNTPQINHINCDNDSIVGNVVLTHSAFNTCSGFSFKTNALLTGIDFPTNPTAALSGIYVNDSGFTGVLDISGYTSINGLTLYGYNSEITNINFSASVSGVIGSIRCHSANLTGTLDISMLTKITSGFTLMLYSNPNLTTINFPSSVSEGKAQTFWLQGCDLTGVLDLSMYDWGNNANCQILFGNNSKITSVVFPSSITGALSTINGSNCNLTSLDISMFSTLISTKFDFSNNVNLTTIAFPLTPTGPLTSLVFGNCALSGTLDISMFNNIDESTGVTYDFGLNQNLSALTLPASINVNGVLRRFNVANTLFTGVLDLSLFEKGSTYFTVEVTSTTITDIVFYNAFSGDIVSFYAAGSNIGVVDLKNLVIENNAYTRYYFNNLLWSAAQVNEMLVQLDSISISGPLGRQIYIDGSNASPDSSSGGYDGLAAKASLEAKGFSVTTS